MKNNDNNSIKYSIKNNKKPGYNMFLFFNHLICSGNIILNYEFHKI